MPSFLLSQEILQMLRLRAASVIDFRTFRRQTSTYSMDIRNAFLLRTLKAQLHEILSATKTPWRRWWDRHKTR